MGYLSLEDIYPDDVHKYGHMRVGMTDLYVKDNHAAYGVVTRGECRELTSRLPVSYTHLTLPTTERV